MRKPLTLLALVHAERLEPRVQVFGQRGRRPRFVRENEHPDTAGLPVPHRLQLNPAGNGGGVAGRGDDRLELGSRTVPEERQRDVQVRAGDGSASDVLLLPCADGVEHLAGKSKSAEEP